MTMSSHLVSVRSVQRCLLAVCLLLAPLSGCNDDDGGGEVVSADYTPDSDFSLTHPSGAEVTIPAGARSTSLKIMVAVPPPSRRPGPAVTVIGGGVAITPTNPGISRPATVTIPIMPSQIPSGATVSVIQGTNGAFVPAPSRRTAAAVVVDTTTFGDFFVVAMMPSDAGTPNPDLGPIDAGQATDAGTTDAGTVDAGNGVVDEGVDIGPHCGDGIFDWNTEQCDDGDENVEWCGGAGDCMIGCIYCME